MEFNNPGTARDLFYLASLFFGAGLGSLLNRWRFHANQRFRSRSTTWGFLLLSAAVVCFALNLILSGGKFFPEFSYYLTGIILAVSALLALRFPRAAGFPLVLAAGFIIVWMAYSFGQFTRYDKDGTFVGYWESSATGQVSIHLITDKTITFFLEAENPDFELSISTVEYVSFIPLAGGEKRGIITELQSSGNILYLDSRYEKGLMGAWYTSMEKIQIKGEGTFAALHKHTIARNKSTLFIENHTRIFFDGSLFTIK